jgi:ABC-type multidrug transport system ATPase subunit
MNAYYDFWIEAFGDSGIRKYVIDEIVPALNENINYWMHFLIEGNMKIDFNNEFEETITKSPKFEKDIKYYALSSGQKGRVNLALSQAFAHIMSLNTGRTPSLVFLDEVTSNIDVQGVNGIINMIQELAKDKQVWLITHNDDLLDALSGCDTVKLILKDGITKMEK